MNNETLICQHNGMENLPSSLPSAARNGMFYVFDFTEVKLSDDAFVERSGAKEMFVVSICVEGTAAVSINLQPYIHSRGTVLFYAPFFNFAVKRFSDDFQSVCIGIVPECFGDIGLQLTGNTMMTLFPPASGYLLSAKWAEVKTLLFLLRKLNALGTGASLERSRLGITRHYLKAFVYEILAIRAKQLQISRDNKFSRKEELKAQFLAGLMKHFREERSVRFYANRLFVTPKYLSEVIKELTGKTAGEMINETVILESKLLLTKERTTVKEVAGVLNFGDPSIFGKFFKRYAGMAPSMYRIPGRVTH
jgi:AraC family transcriptional regulator, transcriptional activator of pobA